MSLASGESIGREVHEDIDQFLRVERGSGRVELGRSEDSVDETHEVRDDWAVIVPAGVWHDVVNTGNGERSTLRRSIRTARCTRRRRMRKRPRRPSTAERVVRAARSR